MFDDRKRLLEEEETEVTFFSRVSREFYAYWRSLARRNGGIPLRKDFDPAQVARLLPHIFIVEKKPDSGRFFFRLSGTGIREIMGFENTNHYLDELLHGEDLRSVSQMFEQVTTQGLCIRSIEGLTYSNRSYRRVEIVRLPLRQDDGRCLVLGCLSRIGDDSGPETLGAVKDQQVIRIENDILPRTAF